MRRRLYFLIPSLNEANQIFDKLLLARICEHRIYVLAKSGADIGDLPEATVFQRFDIFHSMVIGTGIGAIIGIIAGIIAHNMLGIPIGGGMIAATLVGAIIGCWSASMIGLMVPNTHHKQFHEPIDQGKLLMMVDVRKERVSEIEALVKEVDPTAQYYGIEPTIPGFP